MTQWWTIADATTGAVLHPAFATAGAELTPFDCGWDGDPGGQSAVPIDAPPDLSMQRWDGNAWAIDPARLRERRWEQVKAQREVRRVIITTAYGPFDADEIAKTNLLGKMAGFERLGDAAPDEVTWKLHDNSFVTLPRADFISACMAVLAGVEAVYAASFALEYQLNAATTAAEIDAIDIEQGWPD